MMCFLLSPHWQVQPRLATGVNTRGNVLGPFEKPDLTGSSVWRVPFKVKEIMGPDNLPLPGGTCGKANDEASGRPRQTDLTPVFFHEGPEILAFELAHFVNPAAIVDLTPGSGHFAVYALRTRIPYTGVCLTAAHKDLLFKRLISRALSGMTDSTDQAMYDPSLATSVQNLGGQEQGGDGGEAQAQGRSRERGRGRGGRGRGRGRQDPGPEGQGEAAGTGGTEGAEDEREALLNLISTASA